MIELYAITDGEGAPLPPTLQEVATRGLAAVYAVAGDDAASADDLWRHEELVEAVMERRDLLPVRYGTRLSDEAAAARALSDRHDELARALDRVRGCVELSLRVMGASEDVSSGAEYMRSKARALRRLHEPLSSLARAGTTRRVGDPRELLRSAYLVDRAAVQVFADRVAELQSANPELQLLCTGPWPPYSFT